jgi:peptide/nickel transport system permease protein
MTLVEPGAPQAIEGVSSPTGVEDLGAARPLRADAWRRFKKNRMALVGVGIIVVLVLVALFADLIAPHGFDDPKLADRNPGPSLDHLFGTDRRGRDMFSRVVYGSRISLRIGFVTTLLLTSIGLTVGAAAGFFGRFVDTILMRVVDILLAIPYLVLAAAIAAIMTPGENSVIVAIGLTAWLPIARIVRSSFLGLKKQEYVEAARALGFSNVRIMGRHILPNALQPIIIYGTVSIGAVILSEAALSFLSLGPKPPSPAWGLMVNEALDRYSIAREPWMFLFPSLAIFVTVIAFVLVGDGLRDALDPKQKG